MILRVGVVVMMMVEVVVILRVGAFACCQSDKLSACAPVWLGWGCCLTTARGPTFLALFKQHVTFVEISVVVKPIKLENLTAGGRP